MLREVLKDSVSNKIRMIFLQLPEFTKSESECQTNLDKWMYLMNHLEQINDISWKGKDEMWAKLAEVSNVAALTPEERVVYEDNLRVYWDNCATHEASYLEGKEKGVEIGEKDKAREIALSLISAQMPVDFIARHTGMTLDEVQQLRMEGA